MKEYGIIYKIQNKINGKVYIGQTVNDFARRYGNNFSQCKNRYMKEDIKKYGVESFEVIEKLDCAYSKEELDELEIKYIKEYDSTNREKGYNIDLGGHNSLHTPETIEAIRKANLGEKNPMYGKCGKDHPNYSRIATNCEYCGRKIEVLRCEYGTKKHFCSKECVYSSNRGIEKENNIRVECSCDNCGKVFKRFPSQIKKNNYCSRECQNEHYKKLFSGDKNPNYGNHKVAGGNNGRALKVICIETGEVFDCARDADRKFGYRIGSVSSVCRGEQKSTHGLHFEYYNSTC